ncbi:Uncharacterised protein [Mycobacteroides abscessus subsp. abscessus]|nr:Uncharacterised protein [Mycobacteroides abscessus subsp. abscessus]
MRAAGSTVTPVSSESRSSTTSSIERSLSAPAPCPVLCGATRRPAATAARTTAATSSAVRGTATAAGRWSTAAFQGMRAAS